VEDPFLEVPLPELVPPEVFSICANNELCAAPEEELEEEDVGCE
jgi:hypothetical protein